MSSVGGVLKKCETDQEAFMGNKYLFRDELLEQRIETDIRISI